MFVRRQADQEEQEDLAEPLAGAHQWSPAQMVALVLGIGFLILGIAALAKTGFTSDHVMSPQKDVIGFRHTPLLGAIEIGFGALLILAGIVAGAARSLLALLGAIATALGILLLIDAAPNRLHRWLGVGHPYGWMVAIVGAVLLVVALVSPDFVGASSTRRVHRRQVVT